MGQLDREQVDRFHVESASDPTMTDDSAGGLLIDYLWYNTTTKVVWVSIDDTPGAARWVPARFDPNTILVASGDVVTAAGDVVTATPAPLAPYP